MFKLKEQRYLLHYLPGADVKGSFVNQWGSLLIRKTVPLGVYCIACISGNKGDKKVQLKDLPTDYIKFVFKWKS